MRDTVTQYWQLDNAMDLLIVCEVHYDYSPEERGFASHVDIIKVVSDDSRLLYRRDITPYIPEPQLWDWAADICDIEDENYADLHGRSKGRLSGEDEG